MNDKLLRHFTDRKEFSADDYARSPPKCLNHRTATNHLASLTENGYVQKLGKARKTRYVVTEKGKKWCLEASKQEVITVTPTGDDSLSDVIQFLRIPARYRPEAKYQRSFLESYRPNETFYLTAAERLNLKVLNRALWLIRNPSLSKEPNFLANVFFELLVANTYRLHGGHLTMSQAKAALRDRNDQGWLTHPEDVVMLMNLQKAVGFLMNPTKNFASDRLTLCNLHALVSQDLLGDASTGGQLRGGKLYASDFAYQPIEKSEVIKELFEKITQMACAIDDPIEQAFFLLVHVTYLAPFGRFNRSVARLAANIPLINHYNDCTKFSDCASLTFEDVDSLSYKEAIQAIEVCQDVRLMKNLFIRSHNAIFNVMLFVAKPNLLWIHHRQLISDFIVWLVRSKRAAEQIVPLWIQRGSAEINANDLVQLVKSLREENLACHGLSLEEFRDWKAANEPIKQQPQFMPAAPLLQVPSVEDHSEKTPNPSASSWPTEGAEIGGQAADS